MDDKPELLPVACKDVQWSRNLVAQMKEWNGRHVSSRQFRNRESDRPQVDLQAFCNGQPSRGPDRVIGRIEGIRVLEDPKKCEIGELTKEVRGIKNEQFCAVILPPKLLVRDFYEARSFDVVGHGVATFERVRYDFVTYTGRHTEIFWKRIS